MNCKKLIIFSLLLINISAKAQHAFPTYFEVLQKFYSHYNYYPEEAVDGLEFAKKKEGWYVNNIDRQTEEVKKQQLFGREIIDLIKNCSASQIRYRMKRKK